MKITFDLFNEQEAKAAFDIIMKFYDLEAHLEIPAAKIKEVPPPEPVPEPVSEPTEPETEVEPLDDEKRKEVVEEMSEQAEPEPESAITVDAIKGKVKSIVVSDRSKLTSIKALLEEFGIEKVTELDEKKAPEFMAKLNKI